MDKYFGGAWTEKKLTVLRKYLGAYREIFDTNEKARYYATHYVDAFSGSGRRRIKKINLSDSLLEDQREEEAFYKGSPTISLEIFPPFNNYWFIDLNKKSLNALKEVVAEKFSVLRNIIHYENQDANEFILSWCKKINWKQNRAIVFLDPFGMEVSWPAIKALGATKGVDMWLLFPIGAVLRHLTKDGKPPESWKKVLDRVFGTSDWESYFYPKQTERTLFGDKEVEKRDATIQSITSFVVQRLREVFYDVVDEPLVLRNEQKNAPLFLFCFAAANEKGSKPAVDIAKDIIERERY